MKLKRREYMYIVGLLNYSTVKRVRWWHKLFPSSMELHRIATVNCMNEEDALKDAVLKLRALGYSRQVMNIDW